jgi:dCMP deaminase
VSVGSYSKCHSRKIGAVLVKDDSVISTGYNGPPRGVPTCDQRWVIDKKFRAKYGAQADGKETKGICPRRVIGFPSGKGLDICPAGHAERNALINAARFGIKTDKTKLYMTCATPCTPCMVEIINSGVEEIICSGVTEYDETSIYLLENSNLKVRIFDFLM